MAQAQLGDTVQVNYTGSLDDGTVFDSSIGRDPLQFSIGSHQVIPGFEDVVVGMAPGESRTTRIEPAQAYGERRDEMVLTIGRDQVPSDIDLELGQQLELSGNGFNASVIVTDLNDDSVTLDGNHPLAGKALNFTIELVSIM